MKYFITLLFLILSVNFNFAQDSSKQPKHGIQFQISQWLTFSNYDGYTFSYRYLLNKTSGLRISVSTSFNENDYDINRLYDTLFYKPPTMEKYSSHGISVQYIHRLINWNDFSIILGGGPTVYFMNNEYSDGYLNTYSKIYSRTYENREKITGYGLNIISGIEYDLSENIVLSGEYGIRMVKENRDIKIVETEVYFDQSPTGIYKSSSEISSFRISSMSAKLGIAVFL